MPCRARSDFPAGFLCIPKSVGEFYQVLMNENGNYCGDFTKFVVHMKKYHTMSPCPKNSVNTFIYKYDTSFLLVGG